MTKHGATKKKTKRDPTGAMSVPTALPAPTERDLVVGREAKDRTLRRRKRPQVAAVEGEPGVAGSPHSDKDLFDITLLDAYGTTSAAFANCANAQLSTGLYRKGAADPLTSLNAGLAVVAGVHPENEIEAMLAVQMAITHDAALRMLEITKSEMTPNAVQVVGGFAVKLLRTYVAQTEALTKLRRGGEQTVRVEHVHVHSGGQAIVGNISQGGGGGEPGNDHQPHAPGDTGALVFAPGAPLLRPDAGREAVPVAGSEREGPVPDARRRTRKRGT